MAHVKVVGRHGLAIMRLSCGSKRFSASASKSALPEGSKDFIAYCDASKKGLGAWCSLSRSGDIIYMELKLLSDYDCDIRYHPGKANVVADALSRKEREPPLRVRALVMTISLDLPKQILNAQTEARKPENIRNEDVGGMLIENAKFPEAISRNKSWNRRAKEHYASMVRSWLPIYGDLADCDHARVHKSKYSIHPGF
ncbi:hypothetical protein Tco_0377731 [Tanacetum coccineum]